MQPGYSFPKIVIVNARFNEMLYDDTLFDCELVRSGNRWQLQLSDIIVFRGRPTAAEFVTRLQQMRAILTFHYKPDAYVFRCGIVVKKVFNYNAVEMCEFLQRCEYKIVGVTFNSCTGHRNIDFYFNKHNIPSRRTVHFEFVQRGSMKELQEAYQQEQELLRMIRLQEQQDTDTLVTAETRTSSGEPAGTTSAGGIKRPDTSTFIIKSTRFPNIYLLYTQDSQSTQQHKHSVARIDTIECAAMMESIFKHRTHNQDIVWVDCVYEASFNKWVPYRLSDRRMTGLFEEEQHTMEIEYDSDNENDSFSV